MPANITEIERRLWSAADNLRANSKLRSHEYSTPVLGLIFLASVVAVWFDRQDASGVSLTADKPAKRAFKVSLYYLFVLFAALALDRFVS